MNLTHYLQTHFGYAAFKPGQAEVIEHLLNGQDTLAVLPTGTGKSLCYQMAGQLLTGQVIIVSPLLSLMEDQVRQLQRHGIQKVVAINSSLSYREKQFVLAHLSTYQYLFFSPEMLLQPDVLQRVAKLKLALLVIDEAHCVYQWGIDFRPEYEKLNTVQQALHQPLTLALTATATPLVRQAITNQMFHSKNYQEVIYSVNRKNIGLIVQHVADKECALLHALTQFSHKVIIYCATRKTTEQLTTLIKKTTSLNIAFYHGGLQSNERSLLQQQFLANQLDILCATNAFGMGIDKPDVRVVIHYDLPDSLENYLQEIGRAGRDGRPSLALLLYKNGDEFIHRLFQGATRADREALTQLFQLASIQSDQFKLAATELQQKWLQGFYKQDYSLEELQKRLIKREQERQQQLQLMVDYIHLTSCRRCFIQSYFTEPVQQQDATGCCDNCHLTFDKIQAEIVKSTETPPAQDWQAIILRLFKDRK